ncbi:MAG: MFS transporter [Candidatus Limnocylindria bacterium]
MRAAGVFEPLRHRDFRLLWVGQTVSMLGTFVDLVALPFQILALGGTPVQLGIVGACFAATQVLFLLFGGAVVDRLPRRAVILASDFASACVAGAVAALGFSGRLTIEHLYVASALFGITSSFFIPAMGAIIPELVPPDILLAGNALRGFSRQAARVTGPVLGGVLVASAGPPTAFLVDALTFLFSFGALFLASPPHAPHAAARTHILREVGQGLRFTFSLSWLWITIFGFALVNAAIVGPLVVGLPVLVRDVLRGDASTFGAINAAVGVGEIVATLLVARLPRGRSGTLMYLFVAVSGAAIAAIGVVAALPVILLLAAAFGMTIVWFSVLWETSLQRHVPRDLLGRVTSVDYFGGTLLGPVAPPLFGIVIERVGTAPAFVVSGVAVVAFSLAGLLVPSVRRLE